MREARGTLTQEDVRQWLKSHLGLDVGERTVGKWETTAGNHPRYEMEAAFALLTGCNLHWLRGEANVPRTHPRLELACVALRTRAEECRADTPAGRVLWCLEAARALGFADALGPMQVGNAIHHPAWTVEELTDRLNDRPQTWLPLLCAVIPLPQRWLETGSPDVLAQWHGSQADRVLAALLLTGIDPERFILALPEFAAQLRRMTR